MASPIETIPTDTWSVIATHFTHSELTLMVLMYVSKYFKVISVNLLRNCKSLQYKRMCTEAASAGSLTVLQWFRELGYKCNSRTCIAAARNGHLEVWQWLRVNGCESNLDSCIEAANYGHFEIVKQIVQMNRHGDTRILIGAAKSGNLEILQWLKEGMSDDIWRYILNDYVAGKMCYHAAARNNKQMLMWIRENQSNPTRSLGNAIKGAAKYNHFDIIKWLIKQTEDTDITDVTSTLILNAAIGGHVELLKWCTENNFVNKDIIAYMCHNNYFCKSMEVVQWLIAEGIKCNIPTEMINICVYAAKYGRLDILKWLQKNNTLDTSTVYAWAVARGHFDVCIWLKDELNYIGTLSWDEAIEITKWVKFMPWADFSNFDIIVRDARRDIQKHQENFEKYTIQYSI